MGSFCFCLEEYNKLEPQIKLIVDKHLKLAGELNKWIDINSFLIDQIHHKKSKLKQDKYYPIGKICNFYYFHYLFRGTKCLHFLDVFPCTYQGNFDYIVCKELGRKGSNFDYTNIFYNHSNKPEEIQFSDFNIQEWELSDGDWNQQDSFIMEKYKRGFISYLDWCIQYFKKHSREIERIIKDRNRIVRHMNKTPPSFEV